MRYLMDQQSFDEMSSRTDHSKDCYARPGRYLHHLYRDGVKYVVARALQVCLNEAREANDGPALAHLQMHINELQKLVAEAKAAGTFASATMLGEVPPTDDGAPPAGSDFVPPMPSVMEETGLNRTLLNEMVLRVIYNKSRITGAGLAEHLRLFYGVVEPLLNDLRRAEYIDIVGQKGYGDFNYEYSLTSKGTQAANEAMLKTQYAGVAPVPLSVYVDSVRAQTIRNVVVTRRNIRKAFADLIISDAILNVGLPLRLPRQRQDQHCRAHHQADGRRHLHPPRGRGRRPDRQGLRPYRA
jgi:DNA-binding PadR family transcriptional regulator